MIVALALRLLVRWRRGHFHAHLHRHGTVEHRHLHAHHRSGKHEHAHESVRALGRTPVQAFAIGMVHGTGGSAGLGVLLLAGLPSRNEAAAALVVFALAAALSMATLSLGFGYAISRDRVSQHALTLAPIMGTLSLVFGAWYVLGALSAIPHPL
jgi:ABC-type nickel/cobalt efflux system permease component RcnA